MKIKNTKISILRGVRGADAFVLDKAIGKKDDIYSTEVNVREVCSAALRKAKKQNKEKLIFFISEKAASDFFPVAIAKILAQEIYRHIREDETLLREIAIIVSCDKIFNIFNRTICGYLTHLVEVLTQGPFVTVDAIIEVGGGIVLIKRSNPPFGWALPGGFVDYGESLEEAAAREAFEETNLRVKQLRQMHTYSKPGRDPRFQTITTVFVCTAKGEPRAASDAQDAKIFTLRDWRSIHMAFDHKKVLSEYLKLKR